MKKRKWIPLAIIALCIVVFALIYTRPRTIAQRYPVLDLSQCIGVHGDYYDGSTVEYLSFEIDPDDPAFEELRALFQTACFRTRLRNLLPRGTRTHRMQDGDYRWAVSFRFEELPLPDGSVVHGAELRINNFFGELDLSFDGEQTLCTVGDQAQWIDDVRRIIVQYIDS